MIFSLFDISRQTVYNYFNQEEMKYYWKTDIRQYLDHEGNLHPCITRSSMIIAGYFGRIISVATRVGTFGPFCTGIRCRRRPQRKACHGRIEVVYIDHMGDGSIFWRCPLCSDKGRIYGWIGSCWDEMDMQTKCSYSLKN
ncbi:hypothetical protein [Desulfonatronovibrio magnus]|uniref:hypothetical protein n=1 Tax=Desulfonatronovibrio magnus TaxID=698827 RepID=UPI000696A682|nr:hypothetical protein [Desulfonatronovibrio magnus]RQD60682.1 MAG: hypothetical protein D5R98_06875 [Desulfonatronovibrio sp. MSAO_Bac4]